MYVIFMVNQINKEWNYDKERIYEAPYRGL